MKLTVSGSDSKSVLGLVKNIFVHIGTYTKCVCVCVAGMVSDVVTTAWRVLGLRMEKRHLV